MAASPPPRLPPPALAPGTTDDAADDATSLRLDDYLPYLINRAGVSLALRFGTALREAGITLQDWRVLAALRERDGLRLTELAARTSIEVSTLSRMISGLETTGRVSRERDSDDARAIAIRLTEAGATLTATLIPAAAALERTALTGLSDAEAGQLKTLLHRVYGNLAPSGADETGP